MATAQAIAYGELQRPENEIIITASIQLAKELHSHYASEVSFDELAAEIMVQYFFDSAGI